MTIPTPCARPTTSPLTCAALGQHEQGCQLGEDNLSRRRRVLGEDHPDTLTSAHNLAVGLRALGEHEQARLRVGCGFGTGAAGGSAWRSGLSMTHFQRTTRL
jgi:hypothetical protein